MPQPLLHLPPDHAVYARLHTDHYPWTEVTVDLARRQAEGLSGVFDLQQGGDWARFVWVGGALRGGFAAAGDIGWPAAVSVLSRAQVSLTALEPGVAELVWTSRTLDPQPLEGTWPDPQAALARGRFSGVLLGDGACSFWQGGKLSGGTLPAPGAACEVLAQPSGGEVGDAALLTFWRDLIATAHRESPLDEAWRQVSVRLAGQHPCLDPFAQEVTLRGGRLDVDPELPADEWQAALLAAFQGTLARLGLRLADLPVAGLRGQPEWAAAGLGAL